MSIFENNIYALLKNQSTDKQELFSGIKPSTELEIINTPSGFPSAIYKGIYIHSRHNPPREAQNLITRQIPKQVSLCIFYGFGLGYLVENFIIQFPQIPCIVIEPDIPFFLKALSARNLRPILNAENVYYYIGIEPECITPLLEQKSLSCVHIVKLRSTFEKNCQYYNRTDYIIQCFLKKGEVNKNTLKRFAKLWVRNLCHNIKMIIMAPGVANLNKYFKGFPALILAAGPSLDQIIPYLPQLWKRMLVIVVDTCLAICLNQGITPDFIIVSDPQYWNTRYIDRVNPKKAILISESSTHPRIFRRLDCPTFLGSSIFPLGRYLESIIGVKGKLGAGGSVSTTAWDFARVIAAKPIYIAGLDLGFPNKRTHFRGGYFEEIFHLISSRFNTSEKQAFQYLHNAAPFKIASNSNSLVLTDQRMLVYKFWFETQMKLHSQVKSYNLSPKGVKIAGMPFLDFKDLLSLKKRRTEIQEKIKQSKNIWQNHCQNQKGLSLLKNALSKLTSELDHLQSTAKQGLSTTRNLEHLIKNKANLHNTLKKLDYIDKILLNKSARNIVGFLIQPLINEVLNNSSPVKKPEEITNYSKRLYNELFSSALYHKRLIQKALNNL